ncbi:MAG: RluA family pseudouridine synthase [Psychrobacter sp.]|nr:RluA family pseudouridine synthase [Psychrobacter sp.]
MTKSTTSLQPDQATLPQSGDPLTTDSYDSAHMSKNIHINDNAESELAHGLDAQRELEDKPLEQELLDEDLVDDLEDDLDDEDSDDLIDDELVDIEVAHVDRDPAVNAVHVVDSSEAGLRIDKLAAKVFTEFSRAQLQNWINEDKLLVDGVSQRPKYRVKVGETLTLAATLEQHSEDLPENLLLQIVYEDDDVLVINKPVGMVVHPGAGNWTGTLVNALLYHYPQQKHLPRAGLVHRIDKDTSGLLLVGKSKAAQLHLTEQLKDKTVYRQYRCIAAGSVESLKRFRHINEPIGRHASMRTKMAVCSHGREAVTHLIEITRINDQYSLVDVQLETGRTHQIRVHLSHIGHPIVGDKVYGGRRQLRAGISDEQRQAVSSFPRQALHAFALGFVHPVTGEDLKVTAPMPEDIEQLIVALKDEGYEHAGYHPYDE